MATVYVTFGQVGARATTGGTINIMSGVLRSESITSSGASAQGTFTATAGEVAQIYCDTAVYVKVGSNPTAAAATALYVPPTTLVHMALSGGDKVAVIDVA